MSRRGIEEGLVRLVLEAPEAVKPVREGRVIAQGPVKPTGKIDVYLLRVFVDVDRNPPIVATAYLTSKLAKYRGRP